MSSKSSGGGKGRRGHGRGHGRDHGKSGGGGAQLLVIEIDAEEVGRRAAGGGLVAGPVAFKTTSRQAILH